MAPSLSMQITLGQNQITKIYYFVYLVAEQLQ